MLSLRSLWNVNNNKKPKPVLLRAVLPSNSGMMEKGKKKPISSETTCSVKSSTQVRPRGRPAGSTSGHLVPPPSCRTPAPPQRLRAQRSRPSSPAPCGRARVPARSSLRGRAPPPTWKGSGLASGGHTLTGTFSRPHATSSGPVGVSGSSSDAAIPQSYFAGSRSACA